MVTKSNQIVTVLIASLMMSVVACSEYSERKDCFEWNYEHTIIMKLSEYGKTRDKIVIPEGCQELGGTLSDGIFEYVSFESDRDIPISTAFSNSSNLIEIILPSGMNSIPAGALQHCTSLKKVELPQGITELPNFLFNGDTSLDSIAINGNITSIGISCFHSCSSLSSILLPESLETISAKAFFGCSSLSSISLPDSVREIDDKAFSECTSLQSISLPSSLSIIGDYLILESGVTSITVPADLELQEWKEEAFKNSVDVTVYVVEGSWADQHFDEVFAGTIKEYY